MLSGLEAPLCFLRALDLDADGVWLGAKGGVAQVSAQVWAGQLLAGCNELDMVFFPVRVLKAGSWT